MVRHTVQNMARERADIVIPDYTATLGQMANQLEQVSGRLAAIGGKPAIETGLCQKIMNMYSDSLLLDSMLYW